MREFIQARNKWLKLVPQSDFNIFDDPFTMSQLVVEIRHISVDFSTFSDIHGISNACKSAVAMAKMHLKSFAGLFAQLEIFVLRLLNFQPVF